jgi:HemY protein
MIRLVLYFLLVGAAALGLSWAADRPGKLSIEWLGYDVQTSVFIAGLAIVLFFAVLVAAVWLGVLAITTPGRLAERLKQKRWRMGQDAVRRGIFAAGAGDRLGAMRAGAIAKKYAADDPMTLLLEAQAAQLGEDPIASRRAFERMLENPEMAELGLRGLYVEAKKAGQDEAAKQFAERALAANPGLQWSTGALFDIQCRESDWRGALHTLGLAKQQRHLPKAEADRRRALLLTQLAIELEDSQQGKALAYALEAFGMAPQLVPAAAVAGRILASQGNAARAAKVLTQVWRSSPHPEIALIYAHARTGDSPRDRLARVKTLAGSGPASIEGDVAVAAAAIEAKEWEEARTALQNHLASNPPARVCRLMARIEAGQNRDLGRAREWLAKAARGAPDPVWVAPDGTISSEWHAVSAKSGALGAFEWKTPPVMTGATGAGAQASLPELDVPQPEAGAVSAPAPAQAAAPARAMTEAEIIPPAKVVQAQRVETVPARVETPAQPGDAGNTKGGNSSAGQAVAKTGAGALKPEVRKPNIFVPGPAPDDPGPRLADIDELETPVSRFRRPS